MPKSTNRLIVAASEHDPDMLYATGLFVPDPFVFIEQKGRRTILLSDLEVDRGRRESRVDEVASYGDLERELQRAGNVSPQFEEVVALFLKKRRLQSAVVPANFPLGLATHLAAAGIRIEAATGPFFPEREAKTDQEQRLIRRALASTEAGMARGMEVLAASMPGAGKKLLWAGRTLTSEILRAEIDTAVLRAGALPANTIVAGGNQACDPHERGSGPLRAESLIIIDIFPRDAASGFFGDMTRTVVRGRASDKQRSLWETVKAGQELALRKMKPGVSGRALHEEVMKLFTDRGFPTEIKNGKQTGFFHGTGHGLGLEIHDYPRFQKTVFKPRQIMTVEPGLYYPGLGGVRIEDVVAITETGVRLLSRFEKRLEI